MSEYSPLLNRYNEVYFTVSGTFGKYRCEPTWSWQPPSFHDYDVWYAVSGQGNMQINEVSYDIQPGSCFVIRPGDRVTARQNPNHMLTVLFCHFIVNDITKEAAETLILPDKRCVNFREMSAVEPLLQQLIELAHRQAEDDPIEVDLLLKLILTRWIREAERQSMPHQSYYHKQIILKIQDSIRLSLSETVNYESVAKSVGFTARYVSKLMKEYTGITLKETVTKLRMERAVHLLTETTMSVTEISSALGYTDIYTFSKLFKRHFGYAPSRLRSLNPADTGNDG